MSDIGVVIANLRDLQANRNGRLDDVGSSLSTIRAMLAHADQLLESARVQRPAAPSTVDSDSAQIYESIRRNLRDVREIAGELRSGRY